MNEAQPLQLLYIYLHLKYKISLIGRFNFVRVCVVVDDEIFLTKYLKFYGIAIGFCVENSHAIDNSEFWIFGTGADDEVDDVIDVYLGNKKMLSLVYPFFG